MPTKRMFDMVVITSLLIQPVRGLVKLWAARHATHEGIDGTVASAAQVAL